jgi:hypothetical protein
MQSAIQLFEELHIPYLNIIDLLDAETDYAPKPDIHWSTEGHQTAAMVMAQCLKQFRISNMLSDCEHLTVP